MVDAANVIIRKRRAYVPSSGRTPDGIDILIEPVYVTDLTPSEIISALQKVIEAGIPRIATPSREEWQRRKDPLLAAAGVRSWKELAKGGQSYAILWEPAGIRLVPSALDAKGRWVDDCSQARTFPTETPLATIVEAILEDARSRPELGLGNGNG